MIEYKRVKRYEKEAIELSHKAKELLGNVLAKYTEALIEEMVDNVERINLMDSLLKDIIYNLKRYSDSGEAINHEMLKKHIEDWHKNYESIYHKENKNSEQS